MGLFHLLVVVLGLGFGGSAQQADDPAKVKFETCPAAVKKTLEAEAKGAKIDTVGKETSEGETTYWADVHIGGRVYSIGVTEDGTLSEMNLATDVDEVSFEKSPPLVQATFKREAWDSKIESLGKDIKYGETIYEATVEHHGKTYEIVVAQDGTLVEKTLVIDEEDIDLDKCPEVVKKALTEHAKGGKVDSVTKATGLGQGTYHADIEINGKKYLVEVTDKGVLISKALQYLDEE